MAYVCIYPADYPLCDGSNALMMLDSSAVPPYVEDLSWKNIDWMRTYAFLSKYQTDLRNDNAANLHYYEIRKLKEKLEHMFREEE